MDSVFYAPFDNAIRYIWVKRCDFYFLTRFAR